MQHIEHDFSENIQDIFSEIIDKKQFWNYL
mgnify:CR=1 FL=1